MAGAKINTKAKGKDDKSKGNKTSTNEENEDHDFSLLRKPVLTSVTGFAQARKIFEFATEELKSLLANECDLLYECKVCRNIFRSLANFISHKRVYCKEKFNSSVHSHFVKNNSAANEMLKIKEMEDAYQESLKVTNLVANENEDRIPLTKDLTGIMEKLTKIKGRFSFDEQQVTLQKIPNSSVAVFQSHCEEHKFDNMLSQVHELDNMLSQDNAVLQSDGSFNVRSSLNADKTDDNVIQISDDEDSDEGGVPKCKICDMQFSTQKTLKFHMKYKHLESRLVYPCPDCFEIFSTSWSVYRHLFKVHRKSAAQIRRLREAIQAKAFRMNNPPAIYEKKKNSKPVTPQKISEEERLDQENQAWMDNMEGDGELPRCGGCGRTFERRAALAAHTHTCQPRSRALQRRPDAKRIEIQIRKDYHKGPGGTPLPKDQENKQTTEEAQAAAKTHPEKNAETVDKTTEPVEKTVSMEKGTVTESKTADQNPDAPTKTGEPVNITTVQKTSEPTQKASEPVQKLPESTQKVPEPSQKVPEAVQKEREPENVLEEATMDIIDDRSSDSIESPEKAVVKPQVEKRTKMRLPFAHQAEKSNLAAFKQRMRMDIHLDKLLCKKCYTKHGRTHELFQHMAGHYKWMRYACKLCNFKNYEFEKLPEHVKVVHKLKGDTDFYFSTVKAIDGVEALELAEPAEESDVNEDSSESRRPSRCSSDSSRLSDDSSSSSIRVEGSRKRKMYQNRSSGKKKKDSCDDTGDIREGGATDKTTNNIEDSESPTNVKAFEENSSDVDDIDDRIAKRSMIEETSSVASRRPVRKKTKPKNEDFEYDLSNLLKMEAQGYRDSQTVTFTKSAQSKKKLLQELQSNYDNLNKEHIGALALLSKKAVDNSAAELKTTDFSSPVYNIQKESRLPNIFARPMVPKVSRGDKMSPRKDNIEEVIKDGSCSNKIPKIPETPPVSNKDTKNDKANVEENSNKPDSGEVTPTKSVTNDTTSIENEQSPIESTESAKAKVKIPAVLPLKFRRQSLELMKNPIINKNISDFSKAGMKTKILLIKPINRNKDGVSVNTPLKFQTIKLKEQSKGITSNEDKSNDQIVVVKVPKVDRSVQRNIPENNINSKIIIPVARSDSTVNDVEAKLVTDRRVRPIDSSKNNTTNSDIINETNNVTSNNNSENLANASLSSSSSSNNIESPCPSEVPNAAKVPNEDHETKNIVKTGCGNRVSSNKPEAMDVEESDKSAPNTAVPHSHINKELTNSNKSTLSLQESPIVQKPTDVASQRKSCITNDAIPAQESVLDSGVSPNQPA